MENHKFYQQPWILFIFSIVMLLFGIDGAIRLCPPSSLYHVVMGLLFITKAFPASFLLFREYRRIKNINK